MKCISRLLAILAVAALAAGAAAAADPYPSSPIRIVVPFPPGGTTDILAREVGVALGQKLGVSVIVENKAGASGQIGSDFVAKSAPNGYTLMVMATHHVINPSLYRKLPYDTRRDFTAIALVATVPNALVVNPGVPARSVADLIQLAKKDPGKLSFGSTGIGGANHLAGELFKAMAGIEMVHIPYKGAAPAMSDLLGGQIPVMFDSLPTVLPYAKDGRLRVLGVTTLSRVPSLPEVPTIDEAGVKGFEATAWFGMYGPAGLPAEVMAKLEPAMKEILSSPAMRERFGKQGADPGSVTGDAFRRFVDAEMAKWGKVVERANVKLD